jgi:hypothetical protein
MLLFTYPVISKKNSPLGGMFKVLKRQLGLGSH